MQIVAVPVKCHGGDVHEFGLLVPHRHCGVHHVAGAHVVGKTSRLGVVVGKRGDDGSDVEDVVAVRDKPLAGIGVRKISPHGFRPLAVRPAHGGGELLVAGSATDEEFDLFHFLQLKELPQALLSHVSACSGERDDD